MSQVLEELRRISKGDLVDLAKMHLSFLVELTTDEWDQIVAYVEEELENDKPKNSHNSQNNNSQPKSSISTKLNKKFCPPKEKELASNIFGNPLSRESLRQAMILVDFLNEDDNYQLEGIFRKSGSQERQQDLRYMLNNGVRVDLKANRFTPVDVSCVLKEFIQKLPEPLLTNNHFDMHYELSRAIRKETPLDEITTRNKKRLKIVQLLLHLIPKLNREFFISLMRLLDRVAKSLEVTKMDERSLATIFSQHILCPRSWSAKQVQKNIDIITDAMEFLLLNNHKLFSGPEELVIDAAKKLERRKKQSAKEAGDGDCDENNTVVAFCARRGTQDTITDQSLAELYAQIQSMPETPKKKRLIKQCNELNGFGTPAQIASSHQSSSITSKWKSLIPQTLRPKR